MHSMTYPATSHNVLARATSVVLFWGLGAILTVAAHLATVPMTPRVAVAAKLGAIFVAAYAYMRLAARNAPVEHALVVGVSWLALGIVTEIVMAAAGGHGWFELLGSPEKPMLRDVLLFAWIVAPALFARQERG